MESGNSRPKDHHAQLFILLVIVVIVAIILVHGSARWGRAHLIQESMDETGVGEVSTGCGVDLLGGGSWNPGEKVHIVIDCDDGPTYNDHLTPGNNGAVSFERPKRSAARELGLISLNADDTGRWNLARADNKKTCTTGGHFGPHKATASCVLVDP